MACAITCGGRGVVYWLGIEKLGALYMTSYDGYFVRIVECQMGIYEDQEICHSLREGKCISQECPSMRVCVKDDGEEGWRRLCNIQIS